MTGHRQSAERQAPDKPCLSRNKHSCRWRLSARVCVGFCDNKECKLAVQIRQEIIDPGEKAARSSSVKCQISEVDGG